MFNGSTEDVGDEREERKGRTERRETSSGVKRYVPATFQLSKIDLI